jgi:hypothetical protein
MENSKMNDTFDADLTSGIAAFDSKNFSMAYQLLSPLADAGNSESQWRIGMMQMNGLGMVGNQKLAFENFMKAAKKEHPFAHHMIAVAYMSGEGVDKDINKAIDWFIKAAEYNIAGPMYALGMLFENGNEVEQDLKKAQYWFDKAENISN